MNLWQRWVLLLERKEAATSLALCRIATGLIIVGHLWQIFWTDTWRWVWVDLEHGGIRELNAGFLSHFGGLTPENIRIVGAIATLSALWMALGWMTRLPILLTMFFYGYLADLNNQAGGSYDELLKNLLFLLFLSDSGAALSLDARGKPEKQISAWPRWLMIVQLVLMYWMTALQKLSASWVPFGKLDALWYILQQPTWQRWSLPMEQYTWLYHPLQLATLSVWCFEQGAPLLLLAFWFRETRERPGRLRAWFNRVDFRFWYLLFGVGMHLGIEALMEVGPFSMASLTLYIACVHPEEWRRFFARFRAGS